MDLNERAKKIECILLDVDGTLTEGSVLFNIDCTTTRIFNIKDGLGVYLWRGLGFKTGFITGDDSEATRARAKMLKIDFQYYGCMDKKRAIEEILQTSGLKAENIAFMGDDLIDIPVMKRVGFAIAVKDAVRELDEFAHYKTQALGGRGAVREVIELILKAKGLWSNVVEKFSSQ